MTSDWRDLVHPHRVQGNAVTARLDRDRSHAVYVVKHEDGWEISGAAADAETLERVGLDHAELWRRNRYQDLVGYLVDDVGTAWVTAWLPFAGCTSAEFRATLHEVAVEADRLEYYCTGADDL